MVPNFRLPLLTNGSFPQNETHSPIKASLHDSLNINPFVAQINFKNRMKEQKGISGWAQGRFSIRLLFHTVGD
jgi:hypothetical protein